MFFSFFFVHSSFCLFLEVTRCFRTEIPKIIAPRQQLLNFTTSNFTFIHWAVLELCERAPFSFHQKIPALTKTWNSRRSLLLRVPNWNINLCLKKLRQEKRVQKGSLNYYYLSLLPARLWDKHDGGRERRLRPNEIYSCWIRIESWLRHESLWLQQRAYRENESEKGFFRLWGFSCCRNEKGSTPRKCFAVAIVAAAAMCVRGPCQSIN